MNIPLHRNLIQAILIYILCFITSTVLFALLYFGFSKYFQLESTIENEKPVFINWLYFSIMNFFGAVDYDKVPSEIRLLLVIQHFVDSIILPLTSGIIFYFILNRPPNIIFPDKLLIRQRTSDGSTGLVTLSMIVVNKDKFKVYNVSCQLIYTYYKVRKDKGVDVNAETNLLQSVPYIDNIYRFSFPLELFPRQLIETLINKPLGSLNDRFTIIITGKFGKFGDSFMSEKQYFISDVEIAKSSKPIFTYDNPDNLTKSKFSWTNINKLIYYPEEERQELVNKIRQILSNKTT